MSFKILNYFKFFGAKVKQAFFSCNFLLKEFHGTEYSFIMFT